MGSRFVELYKKSYNLLLPDEKEFDITNLDLVKNFTEARKIDVIIHFAAFTNVNAAEVERGNKQGLCWKVNVIGTENLLKATKGEDIHFIHISTDMVFSGSESDPGPYNENHPLENDISKLTWYGHSKAEGEKAVQKALGDKMTILRLIYPVRSNYPEKLDYLRSPLKRYKEGNIYPLFTDQQISISFIDEIAVVLDRIIQKRAYGIYHASSPDITTPYRLIFELIKLLYKDTSGLEEITLEEFLKTTKSPNYRYPKYGGLSVKRTEKDLGLKFSSTREILQKLSLH